MNTLILICSNSGSFVSVERKLNYPESFDSYKCEELACEWYDHCAPNTDDYSPYIYFNMFRKEPSEALCEIVGYEAFDNLLLNYSGQEIGLDDAQKEANAMSGPMLPGDLYIPQNKENVYLCAYNSIGDAQVEKYRIQEFPKFGKVQLLAW